MVDGVAAAVAAATAVKNDGNAEYQAGNFESAVERYETCLAMCEDALNAAPMPESWKIGDRVRYNNGKGYGMVMSCFPMFDEHFLKDLGTDEAIWVGEPGGDLRRFSRLDLKPMIPEILDVRMAVVQNLAAVSLKKGEADEAVRWADCALVMDGKAPKALLRMGAALLRQNKPGPASDYLTSASKAMPKDPEVRRLLREAIAKRSPNWVCASGCCGPWGIVCGGPISTSTAEVIRPAQSIRETDNVQDGSQQRDKGGDVREDCSGCESDAALEEQQNDSKSSSSNSSPATPRANKAAVILEPSPNSVEDDPSLDASAVRNASVLDDVVRREHDRDDRYSEERAAEDLRQEQVQERQGHRPADIRSVLQTKSSSAEDASVRSGIPAMIPISTSAALASLRPSWVFSMLLAAVAAAWIAGQINFGRLLA